MTRQDIIKELRSQGLNLFPLKPNSKLPAIKWKKYQSKKFDGVIPLSCNYAVICGFNNLIVLDLDNKELLEDFKEYSEKTLTVETKRGIHLYFKHIGDKLPNTLRLENGKCHIDLQSSGAYVVGPESIHPETKQSYKIITDKPILEIDIQFVIMKLEKLGFKADFQKSSDIAKGNIQPGNRHNSALKFANSLLFIRQLDEIATEKLMMDWNKDLPIPLPTSEIKTIIKDAINYHRNNEGVTSQKLELGQRIDEKEEKIKLSQYAELIMKDYKFKTLTDTKEILFYKEGVYIPNGEIIIAKECEKIIPDCSKYKVSEVTAIIQRRTFTKRDEFNRDLSIICMENGRLCLDCSKLLPFDPSFLITIKIPVKYNPKARCPKFIKFLKDCLSDQEDIITVIEEGANILTTNRKNFEVSHIWIGDGSNAKSTAMKIIRGVYGSENGTSISIHAIEKERFALSNLDWKLYNYYADISNEELDSLGKFKQVVSGDMLTIEKKNKDHFQTSFFAKHGFSANEMPNIRDNSDGAFRRIYVTKWEKQFIGKDRIEDYDKIILKDEKSGIFNIFLNCYRTMMRNKGFRYKQSIAQVRETIKKESDKLREFVTNCLIEDQNSYIIKDDLFQVYVKYCKKNSFYNLSKIRFVSRFPNYLGTKDDSKKFGKNTKRIWSGVKFNDESLKIQGIDVFW